MMKDLVIRAVTAADEPQLREWAEKSGEKLGLVLFHPHGLVSRGVETVIADKPDGTTIGSLTGQLVVVLDPYIGNPDAKPLEAMAALVQMSRALEFWGTTLGAVDAAIVISDKMPEFQRIVERCGFTRAEGGFTIFSRSLDTAPRQSEAAVVEV